ncbi:MAG: ABC transporter substrate-binding protein [Alphaproteobacteria bacterium]|nr:ABC transporter substrate-binding protein [Alphaproteobacteria bacterium]
MISKKLFAFISALMLLCFSSAHADETKARDFVTQSGYELITALGTHDLEEKYQALDNLFETKTDTFYIAKFVLGPYYTQLDAEQKEQYHQLFLRYIKSLYKTYPLNFDTSSIDFSIGEVIQKGKFYDVKCLVDLPEKFQTENLKQVGVDFRLHETDDGVKLIDFKLDGVSMLLTFRTKFVQMIKNDEEEISWFLEDLEDLTVSNEMQIRQ